MAANKHNSQSLEQLNPRSAEGSEAEEFIPMMRRTDMQAMAAKLGLLERYIQLGVEDSQSHHLCPVILGARAARFFTEPYRLNSYPYGDFRRWTLVYNRDDGRVGVEDWVVNSREGYVGAWALRSTVGPLESRDSSTAPLFAVVGPGKIVIHFGQKYEEALPERFELEMGAVDSELDEFLAAAKPFVGGGNITFNAANPEAITRVPYATPYGR